MTLAEKVRLIGQYGNEIAFGYSDSGCFWRLQYGPRGCGSMMEGFGKELIFDDPDVDADDFEAAVDYFVAELERLHGKREVPKELSRDE